MRTNDLPIVLRDVGLLALVVGAMAVGSFPVAVVFGEGYALGPLGATALASLGVWALLYLPFIQLGPQDLHSGAAV